VDLLATRRRRRCLFAALYFSEGAPIGYLWWALPTKLRAAGVPIEEVAAIGALLTLPWSFKFLWAPLVDAFRSSRFGLRPWILGTQLAMGLTLMPLFFVDLAAQRHLVVRILVLHAFFAATQDVSIDALAMKSIPPAERGATTGWMQLGMLLGRAFFGGVTLWLESMVGPQVVVGALIAAIWSSSLLAVFAGDRGGGPTADGGQRSWRVFAATLRSVFRLPATWLGFAFAVLAGSAMEATGALAGPMMIDRGIPKSQVGWFFALPAVASMAIGALAGGRLADRRRIEGAAAAIIATAGCTLLVGAAAQLAANGPRFPLMVMLAVAFFFFGALTASVYALLMDLTDPALGGTHFSTYMGAINLSYVWSAWAGGRLAGQLDYPAALVVMAAASLLAIALLPMMSRQLAAATEPPTVRV
jgi:PAT family beta-lactamase induction signal transducer AmpG